MVNRTIPVFFSVGTPHLPVQEKFIRTLKDELFSLGFDPQNMGDNQYSYLSPMEAIRQVMQDCHGAVIVGMERTHALIGYDRPGSDREEEFTHRRRSTVWCHLEAGMAYQIGLPLLILREDSLHVEGVLDPAVSGFFVYSFCLSEICDDIPTSMRLFLLSWGQAVRERFAGAQRPEPSDSLEVYVNLRPGAREDARTIEDSLRTGLRRLKPLTEQLSRDERVAFANFEARLVSLLQDRQLYGPNETVRSETSRVIYELNRLALAHFDTTFADLCTS